jgi:hypothetical protein
MAVNLEGTDLWGALHLDEAILNRALYNKDTRWPEGFDPVKTGAKFVE